ncbi:MAG: OmpA family protein, partial [Proteobacteria bacterium]|nr:OmpA family protein [Pseudomonadota bacterium]
IIELGPGQWEVLFSSAQYGMHTRSLEVPEETPSLIELDVVLVPHGDDEMSELELQVLGPRGQPVEGAVVYVDGTSRGKTAGGGKLNVPWLAPGPREVTIDAALHSISAQVVSLAEGVHPMEVTLDWDVGVVEVEAKTQNDPISDGFVRFLSLTETVPAMPLGRDGKQLAQLTPGEWQILVTSAQYGILTEELSVPEAPGLTAMTLETEEVEPESTELLVRIVDVHERPIQDAVVQLGEAEVLSASLAGTRHILGLQRGTATLTVTAKGFRPTEVSVELRESWQEVRVVMESLGVPVKVVVTDTAENPVGAILRFEGPFHLPVAQLDETGEKNLSIRPGKWRIIAEAEGLEVLTHDFELASSDTDTVLKLQLEKSMVDITYEEVVIHEEIYFASDQAVVGSDSADILDEVANNLLAHRAILVMEIQGHTDSLGDVAYNQALSEMRAEAVKVALVARGVGLERLVARGYGPVRPLASNDNDEGRQRNRRVQFDIVEWNPLAQPAEAKED